MGLSVRDDEQPISLGELLAQYMQKNQVTQTELAADLEISQPYLSMIIRGDRRPKSLDLQLRICRRLNASPTAVGITAPMINSDDADQLFEEALLAAGTGDLVTAEIGFMVVAGEVVRKGSPSLAVSDSLRNRARFRIANIRRDWSQLAGHDGAIALYRRCLSQFKKEGSVGRGKETELYLAACQEMSENLDDALRSYRLIADSEGKKSGLRSRARNRAGVILTKKRLYPEARGDLEDALRIAVNLESQTTYAYILEKVAILEAHEGNYDRAREAARTAKGMSFPGERLRAVQNDVLFADIAYREGDVQSAEALLGKALADSNKYGFRHQASWIARFQSRIERES